MQMQRAFYRYGDGEKSGREERIRTSGPYVPNVVLYQAELLPDGGFHTTPGAPLQTPKRVTEQSELTTWHGAPPGRHWSRAGSR